MKGRDLVAGVLKTVVVNSDENRDALSEPIHAIVEAVLLALEKTPGCGRHRRQGHRPTGGGALLANLDVLIAKRPACRHGLDDPISAVVLGSGKTLDHLELLKEVTIA
ncbi:MAG: rod shape-determining protein [Polyangiaceae bacterium]